MAPSIYHFINYREYLQRWFVHKKQTNTRYSHRLFSRLMQQSSPSFLRDIIDGRRNITLGNLLLFEKALNIDKESFHYFTDLVTLDQSKDDEERRRAYERIAASQRKHSARVLEGESYQYILRWECPAIRELAMRSDFKADPNWIAQTLQPNISVKAAEEALEILFSLKMLVEDTNGNITLSSGTLATPVEVFDLAAEQYHKEMLRLASESIDRFPSEDRHLMGVTVSIPNSLIPQIKKEFSDFAFRMLDLCESSEEERDQTCQLNFQFFPLSDNRQGDR
jgi:uncharacterized protein (TIGR02147 family)